MSHFVVRQSGKWWHREQVACVDEDKRLKEQKVLRCSSIWGEQRVKAVEVVALHMGKLLPQSLLPAYGWSSSAPSDHQRSQRPFEALDTQVPFNALIDDFVANSNKKD